MSDAAPALPRRIVEEAAPALPLPSTKTLRSRQVDGELVYAVGDVHGRYDLLTRLIEAIALDVRATAAGRRALVVFLGDYVDRGPASSKVLSALVWLATRSEFELHFLKGNHEAVMLDYLADPPSHRDWLRFGGDATMRSYGVEPPELLESDEAHYLARDQLLDRMPASHLAFLQKLDLSLQVGDYAFVHAGVRPGVPLARQSEEDLLWIRDDFLKRDHRFNRIIVHGHSWDDAEPVHRTHRIGIDTGAYHTGVLTALRLEDEKFGFLHARGAPA